MSKPTTKGKKPRLQEKSNPQPSHQSKAKEIGITTISSVGCVLLGWAWEAMNTGDSIAPYLFTIGGLAVIAAVLMGCSGFFAEHIRRKWLRYGFYLLVCLIVGISLLFFSNYKIANTPWSYCVLEPESGSSSSNTTTLMLGGGVFVKVATQGNYILTSSSVPFLSVGINKDGQLLLNATIQDSTGKNVATVENNHVLYYQKYTFFPTHPDKHTFNIYDSEGNEVLHVNFIDPKSIYLTGIFYIEGYSEPVTITEHNGITLPGGSNFNYSLFDLTNSTGSVIDFTNDGVAIMAR